MKNMKDKDYVSLYINSGRKLQLWADKLNDDDEAVKLDNLKDKYSKRRKAMTADVARLNSLLEKAKNELTKDEIIALFTLTRKRIRKLEQKAVLLLYARKRNPRPEKAKN